MGNERCMGLTEADNSRLGLTVVDDGFIGPTVHGTDGANDNGDEDDAGIDSADTLFSS